MKNKNLLIVAGVVIVGYLLWKKSQGKVNQTQYSKECLDGLERALQQENVKPPNFEKTFLENCQSKNNMPSVSNSASVESRIKQMECDSRYSQIMKPSVVMPPEYWQKRKEEWMKINCK
jgi:hypothetical protein